MPYPIRSTKIALLLSLVLSSCTDSSQVVTDTPAPPALTSTPTRTTFLLDRSALAYGVFETEATSLWIDISSTVPGQFEDFADISVKDETGVTTYKVTFGTSTVIHSMPVGKKRIMVTAGLQTKFRGKIVGVFIDKITFNGWAVQVEQSAKRTVIYGDSLAVGGNVNNVSAEAWPVLLREHVPVIVDAYGYRALYDDALTAETRSAFASKISSWLPERIWLAIGANDYAFALWSAQDFGKGYAALLDVIHSANPKALVFAQSPILRADEKTPNSFGDNLEMYRQGVAAACLDRSDWYTFVDGTDPAFPQLDELDQDGAHLTTLSSVKYAEAVLNIINK